MQIVINNPRIIEFYNKYYVSNNLSISIVSNLNVDKQKNLLKSTFGQIPKKTKQEIKKIIFKI